jgi:hypothetical protein
MNRLPICDLIQPKPRPELTPSLVPAFRHKQRPMVRDYIFTDSIRTHFDTIFDYAARGSGQGFWVQAEYGAGKTHFLVTLAALLTNPQDEEMWHSVQDDAIQRQRQRLASNRLFPVVLSLRGEGASDPYLGRSLLDVLLEEFQVALDAAGLSDRVLLTAAQDILTWLETRTSPAIRSEAGAFIQKRTGQLLEAYRDEKGLDALAALLSEYFASAGIRPENIASGTKARLAYIYQQLMNVGYNGLLVVIDEYEGWEKGHSSPDEKARDADLLETLGFILPRDLGLTVYAIVASQSSAPAKLQGSGEGDRFIPIPLLSQTNQRDYDVIIARRTRALQTSRTPEVKDHFDYYAGQFNFARGLNEAQFRDVFPFQPRCFEAIRRITARDLPTARSGLLVFWEVLQDSQLTGRTELIRLADMLRSKHLMDECLTRSVYRDSYLAYRAADEALADLGLDDDDLPLAQDLLATLFLWYAAHLDQPRRLTVQELAEATLTIETRDGIRAEDAVALVLDTLQTLSQVESENDSAIFVAAGSEGRMPVTAFNEHKRRALKDSYKLRAALTDSLFFTPREGANGLFNEYRLDESRRQLLESRKLEYSGEVIVASSWRVDQGTALPKDDAHFRLVILTPSAMSTLRPGELQDPRIAVVKPGDLNDEIKDAAAGYVAWNSLREELKNENSKYAEDVRSWLDTQKSRIFGDLTATHLKLYQGGEIITRDNLGIAAREAFGQGGNSLNRITFIVDRLLLAAYPNLPVDSDQIRVLLKTADVGKVFDGYFSKTSKTADTSATRSYGIGLRLSHRDDAGRFAPQQVGAFTVIEELLAGHGGSDLAAWEIFDKLSAPPYGLPYALIQLYLLAFVRHRSPRLDLIIKPRHGLKLRSGHPIPRERITASNVADLEWKPGVQDKFDALVPASGPSWNEALTYAQFIHDDLHQATDQTEIERQVIRLKDGLGELHHELSSLRGTLEQLAGVLGNRLPGSVTTALDNLTQLTATPPETFADFYERAEEIFDTVPDTLRDAMQMYHNLRFLGSATAEIINVKRYLDDAAPQAAQSELHRSRQSLLDQLKLERLVEAPELWTRLRHEWQDFQGRYANEYRRHHRNYYEAVGRVQDSLAAVPQQLDALKLVNGIQGLGRPLAEDLASRFDRLTEKLKACAVDVNAVRVDFAPVCESCRLALSENPPEVEANRLLDELRQALQEKFGQLNNDAVGRVVREGDRPDLARWYEAVASLDLGTLVSSLTPDIATSLQQGLAKLGICTFSADVLAELARQHPFIEEGDISRLNETLASLLRDAFAQARREHPNQKTYRLILK